MRSRAISLLALAAGIAAPLGCETDREIRTFVWTVPPDFCPTRQIHAYDASEAEVLDAAEYALRTMGYAVLPTPRSGGHLLARGGPKRSDPGPVIASVMVGSIGYSPAGGGVLPSIDRETIVSVLAWRRSDGDATLVRAMFMLVAPDVHEYGFDRIDWEEGQYAGFFTLLDEQLVRAGDGATR